MAVGFRGGSSGSLTLAESWDGRRWALGSSPDRGTGGSVLAGVSCTGTTRCTAAGYHGTGSLLSDKTLVEIRH
jgi:hypothetical protein